MTDEKNLIGGIIWAEKTPLPGGPGRGVRITGRVKSPSWLIANFSTSPSPLLTKEGREVQ
jgi:hypothetical protein